MKPKLELRGISKSFGATRALTNVSLTVHASEVHVLAGENGAGKSTLIRILSGAHQEYTGEVRIDGHSVRFRSPADARAAGIATIHQESVLIPQLSIADNLIIRSPGASLALLDRRKARHAAQQLMGLVGLELDADRCVETLSLSERQMLEIGSCISRNARVFVMDEPTSALSEPEARRLFTLISNIVAAGASVIYISHRMDEIYRVGQRISVLRDGELILTSTLAQLSPTQLVSAMVGRTLGASAAKANVAGAASVLLAARNLANHDNPGFERLNLELAAGEIVGLAGLRDSGASQVLPTLAGAAPLAAGEVDVAGRPYVPRTPRFALRRGVAFVPADRTRSIFAELSVTENATFSGLRRFTRYGWVRRDAELTAVQQQQRELKLKADSLSAAAAALSGGNQQKLALVRVLLSQARVLLLDDPTRGVDVAAKADIHELLRGLARKGFAMLVHSTDLDELTGLCSRVVVLFRGRVVRTIRGAELTRDGVLSAMMGAA